MPSGAVGGSVVGYNGSRIWQDGGVNCIAFKWAQVGPEFTPPCIGDANGDGQVNVDDVLEVLNLFDQWCDGCGSDLDDNGYVDVNDVLLLLSDWDCGI